MRLSFIILCCDKDYQMVSSLLNNIYKVWKKQHDSFDEYEVIIVDNRENEADKDVDWEYHKADITIHKSGSNIMQFAARAIGTQIARGDYIWFVDADDSVLEIPIMNTCQDIVYFNTTVDNTSLMKHMNLKEGVYNVRDVYKDLFGMSIAPWTKLISRGLLMDIYKRIDHVHIWKGTEEAFSANEDLILNMFLLTYANTLSISKQKCYIYNRTTQAYVIKDVYTKVDIERLTYRVYDFMWFIYMHIKVGILPSIFRDILQKYITSTLSCIASRLPYCEDRQSVIDWLLKGWSKYAIVDMISNIYRNTKLDKRVQIINCIASILNTDDNMTHTMEDLYEALNTNDVL